MQIRRAGVADADVIGRVNVDSWRAAYRGAIADEVLDRLEPREQGTWGEHLRAVPT